MDDPQGHMPFGYDFSAFDETTSAAISDAFVTTLLDDHEAVSLDMFFAQGPPAPDRQPLLPVAGHDKPDCGASLPEFVAPLSVHHLSTTAVPDAHTPMYDHVHAAPTAFDTAHTALLFRDVKQTAADFMQRSPPHTNFDPPSPMPMPSHEDFMAASALVNPPWTDPHPRAFSAPGPYAVSSPQSTVAPSAVAGGGLFGHSFPENQPVPKRPGSGFANNNPVFFNPFACTNPADDFSVTAAHRPQVTGPALPSRPALARAVTFNTDTNFTPNGYAAPTPNVEQAITNRLLGNLPPVRYAEPQQPPVSNDRLGSFGHFDGQGSPPSKANPMLDRASHSPSTLSDSSVSPNGAEQRRASTKKPPVSGESKSAVAPAKPRTKRKKSETDEEEDTKKPPKVRLTSEQKRKNHISSEQRRRTGLKSNFDMLMSYVPGLLATNVPKSAMLKQYNQWYVDLNDKNNHYQALVDAVVARKKGKVSEKEGAKPAEETPTTIQDMEFEGSLLAADFGFAFEQFQQSNFQTDAI